MASKQNIVSALCTHLSVDPKPFMGDSNNDDIKTLCTSVFKASQNGTTLLDNEELMKWVAFSEDFALSNEGRLKALSELNEELVKKSVLLGNGLKPSAADVTVFAAVHSSVIGLPDSDRSKFPHLFRWMDYIQHKEDFGQVYQKIMLDKVHFEPPVVKSSEAEPKSKKNADSKKGTGDNSGAADKKKVPEKQADEKDKEVSVSLLKIQIGVIRKAWKHPSADSLLVEEIDTGDAKCRQVVSGLAKYCTPEQLTNRRVVLITNVKPGKLRDVMSEGLVLCASNEDHTIVEPLIAPEGAQVGECVTFSGCEGKPEDVLNPKKKQLEKITPHLYTDDKCMATYKGIPFMTSGGPCTSSIPKASIR